MSRPAPDVEEKNDRPWLLPVVLVGLGAVLVAYVFATSGGDEDDDDAAKALAAASGNIFLEEAAAAGRDPFTASVAAPAPASMVPPQPPVRGDISGGTPGLYGGTPGQSSCDKQQLIDLLAANPARSTAWAQVQGVLPRTFTAYIEGLTPVFLRSDTRVTNHGFRNGAPVAKQSVLQAGTAVLVDEYGVPRARCACGNPLLPPKGVPVPSYVGDEWPGFDRSNVTVIQQNTTAINVFTVVNVTTGESYSLPTGG